MAVVGLVACGAFSPAPCAERAQDQPSVPREDAALKVVLFAPSRPVFLRLDIRVDGTGLAEFRERFCARWFALLDLDHDGLLSEDEATRINSTLGNDPQSAMSSRKTARIQRVDPTRSLAALDWRLADINPADGKLSPVEFRTYVNRMLGPPLALKANARNEEETAGLFSRLDVDQDGLLTDEELSKARQSLAVLDADDDETISAAELKTGPELNRAPARKPVPADQIPVAILSGETTAQSVADWLLYRYDAARTGKRDGALDATELAVPADELRPFDADGNGKLAANELVRLIAEMPAQVVITIELFDGERGQARIPPIVSRPLANVAVKKPAADQAVIADGNFEASFVARRTRSSSADRTRYFEVRFRAVDKDKNNYLDQKEFAGLGLPNTQFSAVDADGDGQITAAEVSRFVQAQAQAPMNQVALEVTDESRTLFDLLDTRADRRLSPRELNQAKAQLAPVDDNKDGKIARAELLNRIRVEAEVKRPAVVRNDVRIVVTPTPAAATTLPRDQGPDWFLRMDRNYDGDVSWREFAGPKNAFDRMDADHDGLLSPAEAEAAK